MYHAAGGSLQIAHIDPGLNKATKRKLSGSKPSTSHKNITSNENINLGADTLALNLKISVQLYTCFEL